MRPHLCNAKLPHQLFSGKSTDLKIQRAGFRACQPLLQRFQIRAFFRVAGHKVCFAVGCKAECVERFGVVCAQTAHRQHFSVGQLEHTRDDLHGQHFFLFGMGLS